MISNQARMFIFATERVIFPVMLLIGILLIIWAGVTYVRSDEMARLNETAASQAMLDIGFSVVEDIDRVVGPAMERTRILASSPDVIHAIESGSSTLLTKVCNDSMRGSTEIDAVALFDAQGEIISINTVYADGSAIEDARVDRVMSLDYSEREIITSCVTNDARVEVLEFQTTCDITPALFDSSGLSVAHSVPIFNTQREQIGLVSIRLEFSRLTEIIDGRHIAGEQGSIHFVTDEGGYFEEQINSGAVDQDVSQEVLSAITAPLIAGGSSHVVIRRDGYFHALFRSTTSETLDGGGIQLMVSVPSEWMLSEIVYAERMRAGIPAAAGLLLISLSGFVFIAAKGERRRRALLSSSESLECANLAMKDAQERFELAISGSRDVILDWNLRTGYMFVASSWSGLVGVEANEFVLGIEFLYGYIHEDDLPQVRLGIESFIGGGRDKYDAEFRMRHSDGSDIWVMFRAAAMFNSSGSIERVSGALADISELKKIEEQLRTLAQTDGLTGLWNRSVLGPRIDQAIERNKRTGKACAVLFFDFDRFKIVNDSLGHDVGDDLLKSIAERLKSSVRKIDTAARMGGDEFVVLLEDLESPEDAGVVAEKILSSCAAPHEVAGHRLVSTASIGMVTNEFGYNRGAEMIRDADAAMYQAKAAGRNRVVLFDRAMHTAAVAKLSLEEDLRFALENQELSLHYQPIVNLDSGDAVSAEALLRWDHPERGMVGPDCFISIAEEAGLINPIGHWVMQEACRQLADWKRRGIAGPHFSVNINVAKQQLLSNGFIDKLNACIKQNGLSKSDLKIEVTETTIVDNRSTVASMLEEIRDQSYSVVMDDFGTGHSSLSGIHTLPISELKIDQSFIKQASNDRNLIVIISTIISLAEHLDLHTVGEGVETIDQVTLLQSMGCRRGQGYYFSRPLPSKEFESYLLKNRPSKVA